MRIAFIVLSVIVVVVALRMNPGAINSDNLSPSSSPSESVDSQAQDQEIAETMPEQTEIARPQQTGSVASAQNQATAKPSSQTPTPEPQTPAPTNEYWVYPGSQTVQSSSGSVTLRSTDDPGQITNWYKQKVQSRNYNINNSVQTTANDVVKNTITASGASGSISVEISRAPGEGTSEIYVRGQL